ncbi:FMN-binding negative transcriptional regulator [Acidovorax radicis]|uniref:FMN-binding negative transcriptional regulator n=1 Tax=Acidovorax radicis TaxID=758826 RepID=UPI0002376D77|nr:FMN-binding negative transcriptional regulator [Acidovorax radicis]
MHSQPLFQLEDPHAIHHLMRVYPLATVVAVTRQGLEANLLPLELCTEEGGPTRLRGHAARGHPLLQPGMNGAEVLAVFQSPNAYISPRWYVNGQRSGRLAPSWNYAAVEARGRLRCVDCRDWLQAHLQALTLSQEARRDAPWLLEHADSGFVEEVARRLRGFEIDIDHLTGKRFLSQQRTEADRRSLIEHLSKEGSGAAHDVARLVVP